MATLFPFPAAIPNTDLAAPVVSVRTSSAPVAIPPGGAVLVATPASGAALAAEAPVDQLVIVRLLFKPDWPGIVSAIGGGPQIVRDGAPVFRAGELFTTSQLSPRAPRSAVGQLADGRMVLVTVDGRQPGYSIGMTNFELAQALVRLGAVTGMALDSGGSATMAFDGTLLNRPSEPERPISTALLFHYTGVFVQPAVAVVSPDGDGVADKQSLRYKIVRPSTVEVSCSGPTAPSATRRGSAPAGPLRRCVPAGRPRDSRRARRRPRAGVAAKSAGPAQGRWKLTVMATDDIGQTSEMTQSFLVNTTVGFLATSPSKLFLPPARPRSPHRVEADEDREGDRHRRDPHRRGRPDAREAELHGGRSRRDLEWSRSHEEGRQGRHYVVRVVARNPLGTIDLARTCASSASSARSRPPRPDLGPAK